MRKNKSSQKSLSSTKKFFDRDFDLVLFLRNLPEIGWIIVNKCARKCPIFANHRTPTIAEKVSIIAIDSRVVSDYF